MASGKAKKVVVAEFNFSLIPAWIECPGRMAILVTFELKLFVVDFWFAQLLNFILSLLISEMNFDSLP